MASSASAARTVSRALAPTLRRTAAAVTKRQPYSSTAVAQGASPPLAPFARIPVETEKLVEHYDAIWDDGVAPEVTLDYDCQHISSGTALAWWLGGLGFFVTLTQVVKASNPGAKNPAVNRKMDIVGESPIKFGLPKE